MKFTNSKTRILEDFTAKYPINSDKIIGMYVCGPTVYDEIHIGNARPLVIFDLLFRLLSHLYGKNRVIYVRNITDVDDKINNRAHELGINISELTESTTINYHIQCQKLNCLPPNFEPKATAHIPQMLAIIAKLIANGHAYQASGHVLFDTTTMADYGIFANRSQEDIIHGARVEVAPYKKNPADFILWKPAESEEAVGWDSDYGYGRPGWHLECSAMAHEYLGANFAIHGGGQDLLFPHHQNEIAQSCCAFKGSEFADFWLHNGFVMVDGEKMSKSLGNFCTVKQLTDEWGGQVIRYYLLSAQYRGPLDFQRNRLAEIYDIINRLNFCLASHAKSFELRNSAILLGKDKIIQACAQDLNTANALTALNELWQEFNNHKNAENYNALWGAVQILGLENNEFIHDAQINQFIHNQLQLRTAAKLAKNFQSADEIRDKLTNLGVLIADSMSGTDFMISKPIIF